MASYKTDPGFIASTFKPYVQQMPIDEMVAVGMEKQRRYDEGVQKIQTNIDNIAGLDIARGIDRKYLQSKLNSLGNSLRWVAAGDFSDSQLVNSVGGMVKQIGNDAYIKAAVSSTANDRNQVQQMEDDRKNGKLTPHAEHYYNLKRQQYYSNNSLKGPDGKPVIFSGKYQQSWDIDKELADAIKAVGDSKWSYDIIYEVDPATNQPRKGPDGRPVLSSYATKMIKEGKFNQNVAAAIDGVLARPEARQELTMRGVYNYRGFDSVEAIQNQYRVESGKRIDLINNQIENLQDQYMSLPETADTKQTREQIQDNLVKLRSEISSINDATEAKINEANQFGSLEGLKGALETMKVRNNYMISGVTEKVSKEIIENIPYNRQRKNLEEERKWHMDQSQDNREWAKYRLDAEKQPYEIRKLMAETSKAEADALKAGAEAKKLVAPGLNPNIVDVNTKTNSGAAMDFYERQTTNVENLNKSQYDFVVDYLTIASKAEKKEQGWSREKVAKWVASQGSDYVKEKAEKFKNNIDKNRDNPKYRGLLNSMDQLQTYEDQVDDDRIEGDFYKAKAKANFKGVDPEVVKNVAKTKTGTYEITYDREGLFGSELFGKTTKATVGPKDLADIQIALKTSHKNFFGLLDSEDSNRVSNEANDRILKKYGVRASVLDAILSGGGEIGSFAKRIDKPSERHSMVDYRNDKKAITSKINSEHYNKSLEAMGKAIRDSKVNVENRVFDVNPAGAKGPELATSNRITGMIISNKVKKGDKNAEEFKALYEKGGQAIIFKDNNSSPSNPKFSLAIKDASGNLSHAVQITKEEADLYGGIDTAPETASKMEMIYFRNNQKSTNTRYGDINDPDAYKGAYLKQRNIYKKVHNQRIKGADAVNDGKGGFNLVFYLEDLDGDTNPYYYKTQGGSGYPESYSSLNEVEAVMNSINPTHVPTILNLSK